MNSKFCSPLSLVLLSLCFLVAQCADPTLVPSSNFQTNQDLTLWCDPGNIASTESLTFTLNDKVVYNSIDGQLADGVTKLNDTTITVSSKLIIVNAKCAYNKTESPLVTIPYLNVDEFKLEPNNVKEGQNTTLTCTINLQPIPETDYFVQYLFNKLPYFQYKVTSENKTDLVGETKTNGADFYWNLNSAYPTFNIKINPYNMTFFESGILQCGVTYGTYSVLSEQIFDLSKNHSAGLYVPSILFLVMGVLFTPIHSLFC